MLLRLADIRRASMGGSKRLREERYELERERRSTITEEAASKWPKAGDESSTGGRSGGPLSSFVRSTSIKETARLDVLFARWVYRRALPLNTTESSDFLAFEDVFIQLTSHPRGSPCLDLC